MLSYSSNDTHDRDTCACGCRTRVAYDGLEPRFASAACRARWVARLAIGPDVEPVSAVLDARPQDPPPAAAPVAVEEVAEVQTEFAQRVVVAPQVEALLHPAPSQLVVRPRQRSLWRLLTGAVRKVR